MLFIGDRTDELEPGELSFSLLVFTSTFGCWSVVLISSSCWKLKYISIVFRYTHSENTYQNLLKLQLLTCRHVEAPPVVLDVDDSLITMAKLVGGWRGICWILIFSFMCLLRTLLKVTQQQKLTFTNNSLRRRPGLFPVVSDGLAIIT